MIKINSNFYIYNFNKTSFNEVNNKFSDWFQFILLNLIDSYITPEKNCSNNILCLDNNFEDKINLSSKLFKDEDIKDLATYLGSMIEKGILQEGNFFSSLNENTLPEGQNFSLKNGLDSLDNRLNNLDNRLNNNFIIPEKISSKEEIFSLLPLLEELINNRIFISKFHEVLTSFLERVNVKDFSDLQEVDKESKINWLGIFRLLKNIKELAERQNEEVVHPQEYTQEFNNGLNNREKLQSVVNNFLNKIEESFNKKNFDFPIENTNLYSSLNSQLEKNERAPFMFHEFKALKEFENNPNSKGIEKEIKKFFNFKDMGKNVVSEGDDLLSINTDSLKKGVLEKEIKFYDNLNKKFEIQINPFQKVLNQELIKNFSELGNINKSMDSKNINFHRLPEEFIEMVKDMVFKIQPEGEKKALIKLEPPDMGFLDLEVKIKNKDIEIILKAEKQEVLQEIRQNLSHIKTGLEEVGLNLKNFQLFLGSGFDGRELVKNFQKEENYFLKKGKEEIRELNEDMFIYNEKGNYYYIV